MKYFSGIIVKGCIFHFAKVHKEGFKIENTFSILPSGQVFSKSSLSLGSQCNVPITRIKLGQSNIPPESYHQGAN